jgi:uncharacterized membrane protein
MLYTIVAIMVLILSVSIYTLMTSKKSSIMFNCMLSIGISSTSALYALYWMMS